MTSSRRALYAITAIVLGATPLSCGDEDRQSRPIEILYFVQGPSGASFDVVDEDDNGDCLADSRNQTGGFIESNGFGLQTNDAVHVPQGPFTAPHFFVLENEKQPTRAVLRNLSGTPLTVQRLLGAASGATNLTSHTIPAGACRSISNFDDADEMAGVGAQPDLRNEFRIEVCSFPTGTELPSGFQCQDLRLDPDNPALPPDFGASFLSTIGDFTASFLSRCLQVEPAESAECRTPATFYMFNPQDQISAAMTRLTNQTNSFLQVDLYRNDRRVDSDRGRGDVTVREDI